jgi:hypothetical protein
MLLMVAVNGDLADAEFAIITPEENPSNDEAIDLSDKHSVFLNAALCRIVWNGAAIDKLRMPCVSELCFGRPIYVVTAGYVTHVRRSYHNALHHGRHRIFYVTLVGSPSVAAAAGVRRQSG